MKKISEIAKECGVTTEQVRAIIERDKIKPRKTPVMRLDKHQEDLIHSILYFEGKFNELTIESKMNIK